MSRPPEAHQAPSDIHTPTGSMSTVSAAADPLSTSPDSPGSSDTLLLAFLRARSIPCPRCAYDLRDIQRPQCPECGEPLILKVGSPRSHFGWLILAMAPGCFSGVAAALLAFPLFRFFTAPQGPPWPLYAAWVFGCLSAVAVYFMYRARHRILALPTRAQAGLAAAVWFLHVLAFAALIWTMWYVTSRPRPTPAVTPAPPAITP